MTLVQTLAATTLKGGRKMLNLTSVAQDLLYKTEGALIPIATLDVSKSPQILKHLCELSERDRYLRFGYKASNGQIEKYLTNLKFESDEIYGIFNSELQIIAMAHLALMKKDGQENSAEFGVSVSAHARGRGYGAHLFQRAVMHARNEKVYKMHVHALSENAPMIRIARKGGAKIKRYGSDVEAFLSLPQRDLDSRVTEFISNQYAKTNYSIKEDANRFWSFLAKVQEIRTGVRKSRHQAAE
jgi:RimJ/RimL family protein N-acetyltransferase